MTPTCCAPCAPAPRTPSRRCTGATRVPLYRFALLRCGSADTAADVVQEAFMGLLTGRFRFDPLRGALQAFLFGVARKLILKLEEGGGATSPCLTRRRRGRRRRRSRV
jgi:hypothetical protein